VKPVYCNLDLLAITKIIGLLHDRVRESLMPNQEESLDS
jgi:hypothetical protein